MKEICPVLYKQTERANESGKENNDIKIIGLKKDEIKSHRVHKSLTKIEPVVKKVLPKSNNPFNQPPPQRKLPYTEEEMNHLSVSEKKYLNSPGAYLLEGKVYMQDGFNISDSSLDDKMAYMSGLFDKIT